MLRCIEPGFPFCLRVWPKTREDRLAGGCSGKFSLAHRLLGLCKCPLSAAVCQNTHKAPFSKQFSDNRPPLTSLPAEFVAAKAPAIPSARATRQSFSAPPRTVKCPSASRPSAFRMGSPALMSVLNCCYRMRKSVPPTLHPPRRRQSSTSAPRSRPHGCRRFHPKLQLFCHIFHSRSFPQDHPLNFDFSRVSARMVCDFWEFFSIQCRSFQRSVA